MKKLTIITVNYNNASGLMRTIGSILNQTYTDYEWIVVDGGSTDGSKEIIEQYQDKFAWWCSEPDKGVYNAMNKGISRATGEYVNFMNSGDAYASNTTLAEVFSIPRTADICYGYMAYDQIEGGVRPAVTMKPTLQWWDMYVCNIGHQSEYMKRILFEEKLYDETYKMAADWEWNVYMIAIKKVKTEFIPKVLSVVETGGISDAAERIYPEMERVRDRYFGFISPKDIKELRYLHIVNHFKFSRFLYYVLSRLTNRIRLLFKVNI